MLVMLYGGYKLGSDDTSAKHQNDQLKMHESYCSMAANSEKLPCVIHRLQQEQDSRSHIQDIMDTMDRGEFAAAQEEMAAGWCAEQWRERACTFSAPSAPASFI